MIAIPSLICGAVQRWLVGCAAAAVLQAGLVAALASDAAKLPPLTTANTPRIPGKFVWADLVTDDVPAARRFYARLFGWTFRDAGNYSVASNDDRPLSGMFQRPRPKDRVATPRWFGYISVPNVAKAERAVVKAGGRVLAAPRKMPERGEQAVFADLEGAVFGVVKSSAGDPEDFLPEPGDWIWIQLLSRNARQAGEFYRAIAGYEIVENASPRPNDFVWTSGGYARAAASSLAPPQTQLQPTWLLFVRVKDVGGSVALAKELGGKVLLGPKPELYEGRMAVVTDPTGAAIGLLEWSHDQMQGGR